MIFYKGAGPGTHWWQQDARNTGFQVAAHDHNLAALISHITAFSHPSPYLSFSASFDVACTYALTGKRMATAAEPGYVYEINCQVAGGGLALLDPAKEISTHSARRRTKSDSWHSLQ